jgi:hypothetical protein
MEMQRKALKLIRECNKLNAEMENKEKEIERVARETLSQLKMINGWKEMFQNCQWHYEKYPDKFFDWCDVEYTNNSIKFIKGYHDDGDYLVIEIDLNKPLDEQVSDAITRNKQLAEQEKKELEKKELSELKRLKDKYE